MRLGTTDFPVTGVYRDYSNDRGVVVMDRPLYIRTFHDDRINTVVIYLKKGISRDAARTALAGLRALNPGMRIVDLQTVIPWRRPDDARRYAEGLRLAGLPE